MVVALTGIPKLTALPFYLSTAESDIARNLLIYRYKHLEKAKENAKKLGFNKGALYPMVTMNGEECHNEWEITFEEIHRNGAIAYAIYNYVNYTGDKSYLGQYGLEVLVEISRFWEQRVNYSAAKENMSCSGLLGRMNMRITLIITGTQIESRFGQWNTPWKSLDYLKNNENAHYLELVDKLKLQNEEMKQWKHIIDNMYYPYDEERANFPTAGRFLR